MLGASVLLSLPRVREGGLDGNNCENKQPMPVIVWLSGPSSSSGGGVAGAESGTGAAESRPNSHEPRLAGSSGTFISRLVWPSVLEVVFDVLVEVRSGQTSRSGLSTCQFVRTKCSACQ